MRPRCLSLRSLVAGAGILVVGLACKADSVGPGIPQSVLVTPSSTSVQIGETVQLTVTVLDRYGTQVATGNVSWSSSDSQIASVSGSGLVSGLAVGGPVTITANVGTISGRAEVSVSGGPPSQLSVEVQPSPIAVNGLAFDRQPVVQLRDVDGNESREAGVSITAVIVQGQGTVANATATTDALGRATFSNLTITGVAGVYRLRFESTGLTADTSAPIALSAGAVASVEVAAQPSATAQNGVPLATQPRITVLDAGGNPITGEPVTATVASGGGTLSGTTTVLTDGAGVATFTDLVLTGPVGDHTLSFGAGPASTESQVVALQAGPPASVVILTQPSATAQSGAVFAQQPVVEVRDSGGNLVVGADVDASIASGGGTLGGTTTATTDGTGRATFLDLSITGPSGQRTLRFEAGSGSAVSAVVDLLLGAPALLTIVTQPSSVAQSGVVLAQQPVVEVRDAGGTPIPGTVVTASIASGGGTLGGNVTATTNGSGVATFNNLSVSGLVGDRMLRFTAGAATETSETIALSAGPVSTLVVTLQPSSSAPNAVAFPEQPRVRAEDDAGNPVAGVTVTATIASGGGTLGGTNVASTGAGGVATYTDLAITGMVGGRTLRFSAGGANVFSDPINLVAGAPTAVAILTEPPGTAVSGVTFAPSPVVQVQDVSGNPVPGQNVVASLASGSGTLTGTNTVATGVSGTATFASLSITGAPGVRTLRFAAGGPEDISNSVHVAYGSGTYADVQYCGVDALQRMDVYVPNSSLARPLPLAAFIHGGGWVSGGKASGLLLDEVKSELLTRGYVVVSLDYRLGGTDPWPAQINDVKCAIRHLRAKADDYGIDGDRIGAWGVSAGGHLASMLGVTDAGAGFEGNGGFLAESSRVAAVVAVGGISDMTAGFPHPELDFSGPETTFGSYPGPSAELTNASPITWESADDPPFLLVHGDQDTTVFPAQAQRLFDQLNAVGVNVTLQPVAFGGHNLEDVGGTASPSIPQVTQQIADFFDTHVLNGP